MRKSTIIIWHLLNSVRVDHINICLTDDVSDYIVSSFKVHFISGFKSLSKMLFHVWIHVSLYIWMVTPIPLLAMWNSASFSPRLSEAAELAVEKNFSHTSGVAEQYLPF